MTFEKEKFNIIHNQKMVFKTDEGDLIQYGINFFKSWDKNFQSKYNMFILPLVKDMYKSYVSIDDGRIYGIYTLTNTNYCFLNKITNHYTSFSLIINYLNSRILKEQFNKKPIRSRQLSFDDSHNNWMSELNNSIELIKELKFDIFLKGNKIFDDIYLSIQKSNKIGDESEKKMIDFIKNLRPNIQNISTGGLGVKSDIIGGVDISFSYNGKTYTIQHKRCNTVTYINDTDSYLISGVSNVKDYSTNYYGFEDKNGFLYIINNKNVKIEESNCSYLIPKNMLLKTTNQKINE